MADKNEDHMELHFMECTDRMNKLYPPALMNFKKNLVGQGFSGSEAFELTKLYLEIIVEIIFEIDTTDPLDDEDEEEF